MPTLRDRTSGVVVSVSDSTAARLGPEWERVEAAPEKPQPKRKSK